MGLAHLACDFRSRIDAATKFLAHCKPNSARCVFTHSHLPAWCYSPATRESTTLIARPAGLAAEFGHAPGHPSVARGGNAVRALGHPEERLAATHERVG